MNEAGTPAADSAAVAARALRDSRVHLAAGVLAVLALSAALYLARGFFVPLLIGAPLVAIAFDRVESLNPAGELLGR